MARIPSRIIDQKAPEGGINEIVFRIDFQQLLSPYIKAIRLIDKQTFLQSL